ncbi:MAG TPA: hypothetical protein VGR73_00430 [Bryobacteraceae bacterium]|nr:hypothetical protein [Bryobacteraceae bacterium]
MPLTKVTPQNDQAVTWALLGRLRDFIHPSESLHHPLTDVYRIRPIQAVYVVGLEDLRKTGLEGAEQSCWRFLAGSTLGQAAGAEVTFLGPGHTPILNGLLTGPEVTVFVQSVDRFVSQYSKTYDGYDDDYELRILSIPGLLIEAFWLKCTSAQPGNTAATDHIIPFLDGSRRLELMHDYPAGEFLGEVQKMAAARLETAKVSDVKHDDPYILK